MFLFLYIILHAVLLVVESQNGGGAGGVVVSTQLWCVAKNNAEDAALQGALDWACGPGGPDCSPIQQGGPCYDPSGVQKMASYAFNYYYLKNGLTDDSCNSNNNADVTSLNPSRGSCKFPSSSSAKNGSGSISNSTTVGVGSDSADLNGCSQIVLTWFWPLITVFLFLVITRSTRASLPRDRAWNPYAPMSPPRDNWEDGNTGSWGTSPQYQPGSPPSRAFEAPTPGSGWANTSGGNYSDAGTLRDSSYTYVNAPSPYLPSTPGGQPMTPNSASYLHGTPGGQPMAPGTGGLDAISLVIGLD